MNKNVILKVIFIIVLIITTLHFCTNKPNDMTIRIGILNGPSAVSFIQMMDGATLIDGKKIEIIIKNEPIQIQAMMMRNDLDFAILPTVMAANLYNKGVKYRMTACPIWGTLYLLTNKKDTTINNLSKQDIAVFGEASTSEILLRKMLLKNNIDSVKLDFSYATNNEVAQALLYKKVSTAVVSEPMVSNLLSMNSDIKIIEKLDCEEYINNINMDIFVQTAFLVSDRFIKNYPNEVAQICEAYSNSCNFTNDQPETTVELMVKYKLSPTIETAKLSLPLCNIRYVGAFAIEQELNEYLNIFYKFNPESVGGKLPDRDFIYQTFF